MVVLLSAATAFGQAAKPPAEQGTKTPAATATKAPAATATKAPAATATKAPAATATKAPAATATKAPSAEATKAPAGQAAKAPATPAKVPATQPAKAPAGQAAKAPAAAATKVPAGQAAKAPAASAPKPPAEPTAKAPPAGQASSGPVQGPPPKNLTKQSDGHISANSVPANPDKFESHVVVAGDTLSQIAESALKDSKLWPQLWEMNEHIVNPHWIYPDDKILIRPVTRITEAVPPPPTEPTPVAATTPEPTPAPAATPAPEPPPPPAPKPDPRGAAVLRPLLTVPVTAQPKAPDVFNLPPQNRAPVIKATDVYCAGFIRNTPIPNTLRVASVYEREQAILTAEGQYIRLNQGSGSGVTVGSTYQVIRQTKRIDDKFRAGGTTTLGTHYLDVGQIKVVQVQTDFALARVTGNCVAVEVGDVLLTFARMDVPEIPGNRPFSSTMTTSGKLRGSVVLMKSTVVSPGLAQHTSAFFTNAPTIDAEGGVVYIDLGKGDGVKAGDLFIVYHGKTAIGEIAVLKVDEKASSGLVTYSTDVFVPGDRVELR